MFNNAFETTQCDVSIVVDKYFDKIHNPNNISKNKIIELVWDTLDFDELTEVALSVETETDLEADIEAQTNAVHEEIYNQMKNNGFFNN